MCKSGDAAAHRVTASAGTGYFEDKYNTYIVGKIPYNAATHDEARLERWDIEKPVSVTKDTTNGKITVSK